MGISNKEAFPDFYTNVEATLQMDTPKISVQTQDNLSNLKMDTNMNANRMTTIQQLMSEHCYGSISNRSARPEENTTKEKYLTRLPGYNSTDQLCDRES